MKNVLFLVDIAIMLKCCHTEISSNTMSVSSTRTSNGYNTLYFMQGDPSVYLNNFAMRNMKNTKSYNLIAWPAKTKETSYQTVAYDVRTDLVALFDSYTRRIIVDDISNRISNLNYYKHDLRHIPLSSDVPGLAFATNFNLLYWTDSTYRYIGVMELTHLFWTKIIYSDMPNSIVVHESKRFIFWTDLGIIQKLERSNLLGKDRIVILNSLDHPVNLVIDKRSDRLFWLEKSLKSCDLNGNNLISYTTYGGTQYPFMTFVLYKDIVIFGAITNTFESYKISQSLLTYISNFLHENVTDIISSSLDSLETVTNVTNPCPDNYCDHLCFPENGMGFSCQCSLDFTIGSDGRTCNAVNIIAGQLMVVDRKQARFYQVNPISGEVKMIVNLYPGFLEQLAFVDYNASKFYYIYSTIKRKGKFDIMLYDVGNKSKKLYYQSKSDITDMIADQETGNLYYSNTDGEIHVLDSSQNDQVIFRFSEIKRLYLHQEEKRLYYSDCKRNDVVEIDLKSYKEVNYIPVGICANSMEFDFSAGYAYFGDGGNNITRYDMNSRSLRQFITRPGNISDMAMDAEFLYLIESSNLVTKINKKSGSAVDLTLPMFDDAIKIFFAYSISKNNVNSLPPTSGTQVYNTGLPLIIGLSVAGGTILLGVIIGVVVGLKLRKRKTVQNHYDGLRKSKDTNVGLYDLPRDGNRYIRNDI